MGSTIVATTTTADTTGFYQFTNLAPGDDYRVVQGEPAGFIDSTTQPTVPGPRINNAAAGDEIAAITVNPGAATQNLNFHETKYGNISCYVYDDNFGSQIAPGQDNFDIGDKGIGGVTIKLTNAGTDGKFLTADDTITTTTTNANGFYEFAQLIPSLYRIEEIDPAGYTSAEEIEEESAEAYLEGVSAVIVPGGFGVRGVDGKVKAIEYARRRQIPFLGLCLGMQCAVIEWARHCAHLSQANSAEFDPETPNPVINLLPEQQDVVDLGGTMRLGLYACRLEPGTLAFSLYQQEVVYERHRHRYEFNNAYRAHFQESGYRVSGASPDGRLVEIIEYPEHPFFIACQFHPEFRSRPNQAHPLFLGLMAAALKYQGGAEGLTPLTCSDLAE